MSSSLRFITVFALLLFLSGALVPILAEAPQDNAKQKKLESEASAIMGKAMRLSSRKQYAQAVKEYKKAIALVTDFHGENSLMVAEIGSGLALTYWRMGQSANAQALLTKLLNVREANLGKDHLKVADALDSLAMTYGAAGKLEKAIELYSRSLKIREAKLGTNHLEVATNQIRLALRYKASRQYALAEPLFLQSLKTRQDKLGARHRLALQTMQGLTDLYTAMGGRFHTLGRHKESAASLEKALVISPQAYGEKNDKTAKILNNLALQYDILGQYEKAESRYLQGMKVLRACRTDDHPDVASCLSNLGLFYNKIGQYAKGEALLLEGLNIRQKSLDANHPDLAHTLSNLGGMRMEMGRYSESKSIYLRTLKIQETKLGKNHPEVGMTLNSLGSLYEKMGQNTDAEKMYIRSLGIFEAAYGKKHPRVATVISNMAILRETIGQYDQAEQLHRRALKIRQSIFGTNHPDVATTLNNMGTFYFRGRQYAKAEPLYLQSLKIEEASFGKDHPSVARVLNNLALLYVSMKQDSKAWPLAMRAMRILIRARARVGSSALAKSTFAGLSNTDTLIPCLALELKKEIDVLELFETQRAVGLRELLAEAKYRTADVLSQGDAQRVAVAMAKINALNKAVEARANLKKNTEDLREKLRQAETSYDAVMTDLRKDYEQYVTAETARAINSEQIVKSPALDEETAIIGWIQYRTWLWAYVIRKDGVKWINLAEGLHFFGQFELLSTELKARHGSGKIRSLDIDLAKTYRFLFAPLLPQLKNTKKLIVISQGWAATLPVEMLLTAKAPEGSDMSDWPWLAKQYEISYAPSVTTLDILCRQREKRKTKKWTQPLFALADPPFSEKQLADMKTERTRSTNTALASTDASDSALRQFLRSNPKSIPHRLPGTRIEAKMIARILQADDSTLLLGPNASERQLFTASNSGLLKQCRYVHFATHGLADSDRPELSALVLASVPPDKDYDGILHMREVFHLKLDADLVVLSACQTGLGKNLGAEGIVGLSTAFFFAGTPSLVMSLWNVPDAPTALLMQRFYRNLKAGQTKSAALRQAKAWLRNLTQDDMKKLGQADPMINRLTRGLGKPTTAPKGNLVAIKPFAHPHYWAGFILTGDPK